MGAVAHEIKHERSFGGGADRHPQIGGAPGCLPASRHRLRGRLAVDEVHERHRLGQVGVAGAQFGVVQSSQPGRGMGGGRGGDAPRDERCQRRRGAGVDQPQAPGGVIDQHDGGAVGREVAHVGGDDDRGSAPQGKQRAPRCGPAGQGFGSIDQGQQDPPGAIGGRRLGRGRHRGALGCYQRARASAGCVGGVGKPAQPRPLPCPAGGEACNRQIGGTVKHGRL